MHIVVCDDHRLLAEVLAAVLADRGHRTTTVPSPAAACAAAAAEPVDLCVMDLGFPNDASTSALDGIRQLVAGGTRVVVLAGDGDQQSRAEAAAAGASAFVVKGEAIDTVVGAIEGHALEGTALPRAPAAPSGPAARGPWTRASLAGFLTPRERSVLEGLVHGETTTQLATRLGVRPATARTHVQNLLGKLCVHSRIEAVALAVEHDLVKVAEDPT